MIKIRLKNIFGLFIFPAWIIGVLSISTAAQILQTQDWMNLPALPTALAGQFVGTSDGRLIVINGTNWTKDVWENRRKTWEKTIYALDNERSGWRKIGESPVAASYGASVTTDDGIICLGGQTRDAVSGKVFRIKYAKGKLQVTRLPDLPTALAYFGAALLDDQIYVAGGQNSLTPTAAQRDFYVLNLTNPVIGWQKLEPIPGAGRILPVVIARNKSVFVFGGAEISAADDSKTVKRKYLTDAYFYRPKTGWKQIADVPRRAAGAAAFGAKNSNILIFGGDTGSDFAQTETLKDAHPGFARDVLSFDAKRNIWINAGVYPVGLVTTTAVRWRNKLVIAGGEDRPRRRSAQVAAVRLEKIK